MPRQKAGSAASSDLTSFDWSESAVAQGQIEQLVAAQFMESEPDSGRRHGNRQDPSGDRVGSGGDPSWQAVRFYNAVDLVNRLEPEKRSGKSGALARQLT